MRDVAALSCLPRTVSGDGCDQMPKVTIPDDHPPVMTDSPALDRLRARSDVQLEVWTTRPDSESELRHRIEGAHTVVNIRATTPLNRHVIESSPSLRHIAIWGAGTDHVDLNAARRTSICVTNTPETGTVAVAEHALALLLALARRVPELDTRVRRGEWPRGLLTQLAGNTLGVVGTGSVGRRVAKLAQGIGMRVVAWSLHPDPEWSEKSGVPYVDFATIIRETDALSLHLRLSRETRGILGAEQFAEMRPHLLLVNVARGALIDEQALVDALEDGAIGGAALDVFWTEPLDRRHPLCNLPNVILSPHTAATTREALVAGLERVVDNVLTFLDQGDVPGRVA